jgi:hypothetical protein
MGGGRIKSKTTSTPDTPEHHQEVRHEGESGGSDVENKNQEDEKDSLKKEVKDLSTKLNQLFGVVERLTRKTSVPDIFQEEVGASSVVDNVSGDSNSSESVVPVYSDDHLALCTGEALILNTTLSFVTFLTSGIRRLNGS